MRESRTRLQNMTPAESSSLAVLYRQVLNITLNLLQGQRTQVFGSLALKEFRKGVPTEEGGIVAKRMGGKEDAKYGPASAIFGKKELTATKFFVRNLRDLISGVD